ncbi:ATP-binding cassette domain-containing protein [Leptospira sarikeiensis]|uniref:ABC transporter ATP-binding protein n=1 Tax=Leptospira sarikeiensis TaxID=2484943 RepID=A0A4R9KEP3_9LEPT|nr:ATP-binding cassette domain-containing protein [Leptospira sarikeiensis]TGL63662.1 ABC transporter ATP-binding protein [Leptospira sarikeiensis]
MKSNLLQINNIHFSYDGSSEPLFESVSLNIYSGWTAIVGPNGTGKSTFLKLCTDLLKAQKGVILKPDSSAYCEQRTDFAPDNIEDFIYSYDKIAIKLKSILGINEDGLNRWDSLSHGERKRFQIGKVLYEDPELLAIDEPTNHLDIQTKSIIKKVLLEYKGIGLIVSHDRELLDSLCSNCLFIDPPKVSAFKGNYTEAKAQYGSELEYNRKVYSELLTEKRRMNSVLQERKLLAQNSDSRVSKRGIAKNDHDSREKLNRARVTGKDGVGGKLVNQIQGRLNQTTEKLEKHKVKKEYTTGIEFQTEISRRNGLLALGSTNIVLGVDKSLLIDHLNINPSDKIGITGNNGFGKSSLIRFILQQIKLEKENILYIPQEINEKATISIKEDIRKLGDDKLGKLMTFVTRLGSDPKRLLESDLFSPGETKKLLFAIGMLYQPQLIIMDEPTNHLDIVGTECLETALLGLNCALILVSHDFPFLQKTTSIHWSIERKGNVYILEKSYF